MGESFLHVKLKQEARKHFIGKVMTSEAETAVKVVAELLEPLFSAATLVSDEHCAGNDDCDCELCKAVKGLVDG